MARKMLFFLDFDGVIHHFFPLPDFSDAENAHFYYLPALEAALRLCPDPEIVIASSWRNSHTLDDIRAHFSPDIAACIIGATPKVGAGTGDGARQVEVEAWLEGAGRKSSPWVAIDDMPNLYSPGSAVVACPDRFGPEQAVALIEAATDPAAFAIKHPIRNAPSDRQIVIVGSAR
jgi:hypothetical protein